jgi:hypothetical protein
MYITFNKNKLTCNDYLFLSLKFFLLRFYLNCVREKKI